MPGVRHGAKRGLFLVLVGVFFTVVGGTVAPVLRASELVLWWVLPLTGVLAAVSMGVTVKVSKYWSYRPSRRVRPRPHGAAAVSPPDGVS
jgi:hypothetical protein